MLSFAVYVADFTSASMYGACSSPVISASARSRGPTPSGLYFRPRS